MMKLNSRCVMITQEDFERDLVNATKWENIRLGDYIACHRLSKEESEYLWANEGIVKEIHSDKMELFNPGRNELSEFFPTSLGGYGTNWFLIKPEDYSGPKE